MKKLILLSLFLISIIACKKENPKPSSSSDCDGSTWTYSITASPAFVAGSMQVKYADGNMLVVTDTTMTGNWSKSVTAHVNSSGAYGANVTIMPSNSYYSHYPNGFNSSITIHISKNGVDQTLTGGSAGPLSFCYDLISGCPVNTSSSFNRQAACNQ